MSVVVDLIVRRKEELILGDVKNHDLKLYDRVIAEIDEAFEVGIVTSEQRLVERPKQQVYRIIRKLNSDDIRRIQENFQKNAETIKIIQQKLDNYELNIKLTCVEYTFDRTKLFIYYTAETRIDFRNLVKDLGHILKTRIQMVQIGVRDEAKMLGGLGHCGRTLCCRSFLKDFNSVTIDMAKNQNLSLNITKLSGLCGRLMCCLAYENKLYMDLNRKLPRINSKVTTPDGTGTVIDINALKEEITVEFQDKQVRKYNTSKISSSIFDKIRLK